MADIKAGVYRHYKGLDYQVFGVSRHSETEEWLVTYRCLYGDYSWWVRPFDMFTGTIEVDGKVSPRFDYQKPYAASDYPDAPVLDSLLGAEQTVSGQ